MIPFTTSICFSRGEAREFERWRVVQGSVPHQVLETILPEEERRGGISFDQKDKNARYVRKLGDVRIGPKISCNNLASSRQATIIEENDRQMLDQLGRDEVPRVFRHFHWIQHYRCYCHCCRTHRQETSGETSDTKSIFSFIGLRSAGQVNVLLDSCYLHQAQMILNRISRWDFNIFGLDTYTQGRPLFYLGLKLFKKFDFVNRFQLDHLKLMRTLSMLETGYHSYNYYHTALHAADVAQAMHCYLNEDKLQCVTPFEVMVTFLSALAHDVDHPGYNQTFLITSGSYMAQLYNNESVLEKHHYHYAVSVLKETELFAHFSADLLKKALLQMNSLILATDITRQQEFLKRFDDYLASSDFNVVDNENHRLFVLQIALKCADICNPCRPWNISEVWSRRVCKEFFHQGEMERKLMVPVTPLCDQLNNTVAKIQFGFIQYVVQPLLSRWQIFLASELGELMLENISANKMMWQQEMKMESSSASSPSVSKPSPTVSTPITSTKEVSEEEIVSDEEGDKVSDSRLTRQYVYRADKDGQCGISNQLPVPSSLSLEMHGSQCRRRHSMPPTDIINELSFYLGEMRPGVIATMKRRCSLPVSPFFSSSTMINPEINNSNNNTKTTCLFGDSQEVRTRIRSLTGGSDPCWRVLSQIRSADSFEENSNPRLSTGSDEDTTRQMDLEEDDRLQEDSSGSTLEKNKKSTNKRDSVDLTIRNRVDPSFRRRMSVPRSLTEARWGQMGDSDYSQHVVSQDRSITRFRSSTQLSGSVTEITGANLSHMTEDQDLQLMRSWEMDHNQRLRTEVSLKDRAASWPSVYAYPPSITPGMNGSVYSRLDEQQQNPHIDSLSLSETMRN